MKYTSQIIYFILVILFVGCNDDYTSNDIKNPSLLPPKGDYLDEDYHTQKLAGELDGIWDSQIGLVYYDAETRLIPQLYLTGGQANVKFDSLPSGAIEIHFEKFNTPFMPLHLTVRVKTLLTANGDSIILRGTDGMVRTSNENGEIGVPLPESDDAELEGTYFRKTGEVGLLIDLMLPIPVKALIKGKKKN